MDGYFFVKKGMKKDKDRTVETSVFIVTSQKSLQNKGL